MSTIPAPGTNGMVDVYGLWYYTWTSLADALAAIGTGIPANAQRAIINAHSPLGFCQSPASIAANPYATPITLAAGQSIELFEAEQLANLMLFDDGFSFSIQFFTAPS